MYCKNAAAFWKDLMLTARSVELSASRPVPRLTRSISDAKMAGLCGGLAQYLAVDPTLIRLIWLVATVCFPPLLLGYLGAWILVPKEAPRLASPLASGIPHPQS